MTPREENPAPSKPFADVQRLLRDRLSLLLAALPVELRADVILVLEGHGKLLASPVTEEEGEQIRPQLPAGVWPLLTFLIARYLRPDINQHSASSVAIAVECFVCALDLLDDVEDGDHTPVLQMLGTGRTLNVSTTFLMLSLQALVSLPWYEAQTSAVRFLSTLVEAALVATSGQHRDLLAEQRPAGELTIEEGLAIARDKAGSLMSLACRLGAMCAGAPETLDEQFADLGLSLGIAHQLNNDCHDLAAELQHEACAVAVQASHSSPLKTDLARGKKTLPIILAMHQGISLQKLQSSTDDEEQQRIRAVLHVSIQQTWSLCLLYRERARNRMREIEAQRAMPPELHLLLGLE